MTETVSERKRSMLTALMPDARRIVEGAMLLGVPMREAVLLLFENYPEFSMVVQQDGPKRIRQLWEDKLRPPMRDRESDKIVDTELESK